MQYGATEWCKIRSIYGIIRSIYGIIRSIYGIIRPIYGIIRPIYGIIRSIYGIIRSIYGIIRSIYGIIRSIYGIIRPQEWHQKCENNNFSWVSQQAKKMVCVHCAGTRRRVERSTALLSSSKDEKLSCGHVKRLRTLSSPKARNIRPFPPKVARGVVPQKQKSVRKNRYEKIGTKKSVRFDFLSAPY